MVADTVEGQLKRVQITYGNVNFKIVKAFLKGWLEKQ